MNQPARPWLLADQSHYSLRGHPWEVAVLPFRATEPHNLHLPYGTDNFQVEAIVQRACERLYAAGLQLLLPNILHGVNTNYLPARRGIALFSLSGI